MVRRDAVLSGVTGDPKRIDAVMFSQRQQQSAGAFGVVVAAGEGVDVVADVADDAARMFAVSPMRRLMPPAICGCAPQAIQK